MPDMQPIDPDERPGPPEKIRTWWHPLLAWLLDHRLASGYRVFEEVPAASCHYGWTFC